MQQTANEPVSSRRSGQGPLGLIDLEKLDKCTHCGFCLPTCPTYDQLGLEMDSPRGRLYLMHSVVMGRSKPDTDFEKHMYRCLECRACESACPSGVPFGTLMEQARAMVEQTRERPAKERFLMKLAFDSLLPRQGRLNLLFTLLWMYQRSGLAWVARKSGVLNLLGKAGESEAFLPPVPSPAQRRALREVMPAKGERRYRVGFISGCIMHPMFADVNLATVRVLAENGCDVVTPKAQGCCGALHLHNGVRDKAIALAKHNIDVFAREDLDAIVINSAGCGATLKEYGELLAHDPDYAERAHAFSDKMRDVTEWLAEIGFAPPTHPIHRRVTYDDPCHLLHGQGIGIPPRKLLESIPGIQFTELRDADWCCGSAGIYNLVQPELSERILRRKMENVRATEAEIVATANPGCLLQLRAGVRQAGLPMRVMHVMELLDWAYRGVEPDSVRRGF